MKTTESKFEQIIIEELTIIQEQSQDKKQVQRLKSELNNDIRLAIIGHQIYKFLKEKNAVNKVLIAAFGYVIGSEIIDQTDKRGFDGFVNTIKKYKKDFLYLLPKVWLIPALADYLNYAIDKAGLGDLKFYTDKYGYSITGYDPNFNLKDLGKKSSKSLRQQRDEQYWKTYPWKDFAASGIKISNKEKMKMFINLLDSIDCLGTFGTRTSTSTIIEIINKIILETTQGDNGIQIIREFIEKYISREQSRGESIVLIANYDSKFIAELFIRLIVNSALINKFGFSKANPKEAMNKILKNISINGVVDGELFYIANAKTSAEDLRKEQITKNSQFYIDFDNKTKSIKNNIKSIINESIKFQLKNIDKAIDKICRSERIKIMGTLPAPRRRYYGKEAIKKREEKRRERVKKMVDIGR